MVITNLEDLQSTQKSFYSLIAKAFLGYGFNGFSQWAYSQCSFPYALVTGLLWVQFYLPPYNIHSLPQKKKTGIKGFNLN